STAVCLLEEAVFLLGDLRLPSVALIDAARQNSTRTSRPGKETDTIMPLKDKSAEGGPSVSPQEALDFHASGRPGKLEINPTKPMATQRDLSLAYSPGVAVPVKAIAEDPSR